MCRRLWTARSSCLTAWRATTLFRAVCSATAGTFAFSSRRSAVGAAVFVQFLHSSVCVGVVFTTIHYNTTHLQYYSAAGPLLLSRCAVRPYSSDVVEQNRFDCLLLTRRVNAAVVMYVRVGYSRRWRAWRCTRTSWAKWSPPARSSTRTIAVLHSKIHKSICIVYLLNTVNAGLFYFRYFHFGKWVDVCIDDRCVQYNVLSWQADCWLLSVAIISPKCTLRCGQAADDRQRAHICQVEFEIWVLVGTCREGLRQVQYRSVHFSIFVERIPGTTAPHWHWVHLNLCVLDWSGATARWRAGWPAKRCRTWRAGCSRRTTCRAWHLPSWTTSSTCCSSTRAALRSWAPHLRCVVCVLLHQQPAKHQLVVIGTC